MNHERDYLVAEIRELEGILEGIPEDAVIDRFSFEKRLASAQAALAEIPLPEFASEMLKLTFRGRPVDGSHGISSDFAGKAANAFTDAFSSIMAGLTSNLRYMGPIPKKSKHPLMITGTAIGSFGFEMEVPRDDELFKYGSAGDKAVEMMRELLRVSAEGSDDDLTEIVDAVHPRAVTKVSSFLRLMVNNGAWCGLEFRDRYFRFTGLDQVDVSRERLAKENIDVREESVSGEFIGILPKSRAFEFELSSDASVIKGKIGPAIEDPDIITRDWLHLPVQIKLEVLQVGHGRPRYTLSGLEDLRRLEDQQN